MTVDRLCSKPFSLNRQLTEKPEWVRALARYEEIVHDMLAIGFQIEPLVGDESPTALTVQRRFGLLTNNALSVAIARRLRVRNFVSTDKAFAQAQGLSVFPPDDLGV